MLSQPGHSVTRTVIARGANGLPRTYRLAPESAPQSAYRRLALAIVGLDVASLAADLWSSRHVDNNQLRAA